MNCALLILSVAVALFGFSSMRPERLPCEYCVNPEGVDSSEPRLSRVLAPVNPKARRLRQTAYHVRVASTGQMLRNNAGISGIPAKWSRLNQFRWYIGASHLPQAWRRSGRSRSGPGRTRQRLDLSGRLVNGAIAGGGLAGPMGRPRREGLVRDTNSPYRDLEQARWVWDLAVSRSGTPASELFFREAFAIPEGRKVKRAICMAGADNQAEVFFNWRRSQSRPRATCHFPRGRAPDTRRRQGSGSTSVAHTSGSPGHTTTMRCSR
jgi:hypothetical protein